MNKFKVEKNKNVKEYFAFIIFNFPIIIIRKQKQGFSKDTCLEYFFICILNKTVYSKILYFPIMGPGDLNCKCVMTPTLKK